MGRTSVKVSDALEGIQRRYTETAPLIYFVEENPTYVVKDEDQQTRTWAMQILGQV
jgi:hypothetical protein